MLHCIVMATNFEGYAEIYDKMRAVNPKKENEHGILRRFTHTPASMQLDSTAKTLASRELVARLFAQTTDLEIDYVKESVFGVSGVAPIIAE